MSPHAQDLPTAELPTISFAKLANNDPDETERLLAASRFEGFFYLDLEGRESQNIDLNRRSVLDFMEKYFAQPLAVKMQDDRQSETHGYKPVGRFAGAAENRRDLYETLKVHREELVADSGRLPAGVRQRKALFDAYIGAAQHITQTLLARLSDGLGVPAAERFELAHREGKPTRTALVMLSYPPSDGGAGGGVGHNKHTDIGSLTLLFADEWGLQVLSPRTNAWEYVAPRPGCAVINIGDSLRFLSGHRLNSCVHRVVPAGGGATQREHRYSLAYFLRAEDGALYTDSKGRTLTAREWHDGKYRVFAQTHELQEKDVVLTGGMERENTILVR